MEQGAEVIVRDAQGEPIWGIVVGFYRRSGGDEVVVRLPDGTTETAELVTAEHVGTLLA